MPYLGNQHIVGDSVHNFKVLDDISSYTETFDGSASSVVSTSDETIKVINHRFVQGQRVTYNNGGGGNIGGISSGTAYYITYDSANTIKLATTLANANNNTNINLTSVGSGTSHTLTAAFDGVNKKFRITHGGGTRARFSQASQLRIAINNVIQKANNDHLNFSEGYAIAVRSIIVFQTAPTVNDVFFGSLLGETLGTFDLSDHKIDNHTGDGSTVNFSLSRNVPNVQSLLVTLDGVLQHASDATTSRAYSLIADNIIRFTAAPASGVQIQIRHLGFAGAATGEVSGFYGRTGNVTLGVTDNISIGDISTSKNINATGIVTASSFVGDGSGLIGVASTDNIVTGTAATFNTYPVDINAGMTVAGVATFAGNVLIAGTLTYEDVTNIDSVGIITGKGADINGDLDVDGHTNLDNVSVAGVSTFSDDVTFTGAGGNVVFDKSDNSLNIKDGCALKFGDGNDLSIFHGGSGLANATFIDENGSGRLRIRTNDYVEIGKIASAEMSARFFADGAVELYHDNVKRLETSAKGIQVGTGVTIESNGQATFVGVVTFGSGSTTIDDNVVNVGTALTLGHTQGLQFHTQNLHSAGFEVNQINASGIITASSFSGSGASLTSIPAGNLTGTVADARISTLTASKLTGALPAISGANLTNLDASDLASGTVPTARLGSGTANNTTFLRGDSTFQTVVTDLVNDSSPQLGGDLDTNSHHIFLDDNHYVYFGAGNDLGLYSDGSGGFIKTDDLTIGSFTGGEKYIDATLNGAVEIYHNDVKALSTSSTGINVWGNSGNGILDIYPTGSAVYAILNLHNVAGGSASNAQLISNSGQSVYLGSGGTGEVVLRTGNSQNKVRGVHNGATELYHSSTKKLETTANGNRLYGTQQDLYGDVKFDNQTNSGMDLRWDESLNRLHFEQDNIKAVFGAGSDFEIFHDGTTNRFQSNGLKNFQFNPKDTDVGLKIIGDGGVELYHDGGNKFETSSFGATVNGTGALKFPVGTTAQRPSASTGMVRYNSTTSQLEVYDGSEWANVNSQPFEASGGSTSTSSRSGYKVHTFTSPGTFTVSGDVTNKTIEVLAIGGGGAGGEGGGGAGALRFTNNFTVSPGNYSVSIGGGGSGNQGQGNNGNPTSFGNISAPGGGGGGGSSRSNGNPGGSGGGCRRDNGGSRGNGASSGGSNNSNSPSSGWGNRGGSGNVGNWCGGGGGGGAGGVGGQGNGGSPNGERGGPGGSGLSYSINGSSVQRAGGGGGGCEGSGNPSGPGRGGNTSGGGGRGGVSNQVPGSFGASAGSSNTGGGGGGNASTSYSGGNHSGGSGIVIVAYTV